MGSRGGQGQNQSQPEERWRVRINYRRCESVQAGGLLVSEGLMPIWRYWKHVSQLARLHGGFPTLSFIFERHIISFHSRPLYFPQHRPTPIWSVLVFFFPSFCSYFSTQMHICKCIQTILIIKSSVKTPHITDSQSFVKISRQTQKKWMCSRWRLTLPGSWVSVLKSNKQSDNDRQAWMLQLPLLIFDGFFTNNSKKN